MVLLHRLTVPIVLFALTYVAIQSWYYAFQFTPLNPDAGYYLSVTQQILNHKKLYLDIFTVYPPVAFYIFSFAANLNNGILTSQIAQLTIIFVHVLTLVLMYLFLGYVTYKKTARIIVLLIFSFACYVYEGQYIVLEPFLVLFSLIAILIYLKSITQKNHSLLLFAGIFAALGFFVKQYGACLILGMLSHIVIFPIRTSQFKRILYFSVGLAIPTLLFLLICYFHNLPLLEIVTNLLFYEYQRTSDYFSSTILQVVIYFPFLLVVPLLLKYRPVNNHALTLSLLVICFSLPILLIRQYKHYVLLLIPYFSLIALYVLDTKNKLPKRSIFKFLTTLSIAISLVTLATTSCFLATSFKRGSYKALQIKTSQLIADYVPLYSTVFIMADPAYLFMNKLITKNTDGLIDFGFNDNLDSATVKEMLQRSDYFIFDIHDHIYGLREAAKVETSINDFFELINKMGYQKVLDYDNRLYIWKMNKINHFASHN